MSLLKVLNQTPDGKYMPVHIPANIPPEAVSGGGSSVKSGESDFQTKCVEKEKTTEGLHATMC